MVLAIGVVGLAGVNFLGMLGIGGPDGQGLAAFPAFQKPSEQADLTSGTPVKFFWTMPLRRGFLYLCPADSKRLAACAFGHKLPAFLCRFCCPAGAPCTNHSKGPAPLCAAPPASRAGAQAQKAPAFCIQEGSGAENGLVRGLLADGFAGILVKAGLGAGVGVGVWMIWNFEVVGNVYA